MALPTPPADDGAAATVFYDGTCGLCHGAVRFIVLRDPKARFRFAPLDGETIRGRLRDTERENLPDSMVVLTADGQLLVRAAAVRFIGARLGGIWRVTARLGGIVPQALADRLYDAVAAVRHRLFRRPSDSCPVVPEHLRDRFDD